MMKHEIYTEEDLIDTSDEDKNATGSLYYCVVKMGMKICKRCGLADSDLKHPCKKPYINK